MGQNILQELFFIRVGILGPSEKILYFKPISILCVEKMFFAVFEFYPLCVLSFIIGETAVVWCALMGTSVLLKYTSRRLL